MPPGERVDHHHHHHLYRGTSPHSHEDSQHPQQQTHEAEDTGRPGVVGSRRSFGAAVDGSGGSANVDSRLSETEDDCSRLQHTTCSTEMLVTEQPGMLETLSRDHNHNRSQSANGKRIV